MIRVTKCIFGILDNLKGNNAHTNIRQIEREIRLKKRPAKPIIPRRDHPREGRNQNVNMSATRRVGAVEKPTKMKSSSMVIRRGRPEYQNENSEMKIFTPDGELRNPPDNNTNQNSSDVDKNKLEIEEPIVESVFNQTFKNTRHRKDQKDDFCGSELLKNMGLLGELDKSQDRLRAMKLSGECQNLPRRIRYIIHQMDKYGYVIGIETINTALYILKIKDLVRQAFYMSEWGTTTFGIKPDIKSFNILLTAAGRLGAADVRITWKKLIENVEPDLVSYNTLLFLAPYREIKSVLKYVQNLSGGSYIMCLAVYNGIIQRAESNDELMEWFNKLLKQKLSPDDATMVSMLKSCSLRGDVTNAENIHLTIVSKYNLRRNKWFWGAFLKTYYTAADYDGFCSVWKRMTNPEHGKGIKPTVHSYLLKAKVLSRCVRSPGDYFTSEIIRFASEIEILGHLTHYKILEYLFRGLARVEDVKTSHQLANFIKEQQPKFQPNASLATVYEEATKEKYELRRNKEMLPLWETHESTWATRKTSNNSSSNRSSDFKPKSRNAATSNPSSWLKSYRIAPPTTV